MEFLLENGIQTALKTANRSKKTKSKQEIIHLREHETKMVHIFQCMETPCHSIKVSLRASFEI
jgi:hypothetical protein